MLENDCDASIDIELWLCILGLDGVSVDTFERPQSAILRVHMSHDR